MEDKNNTLYSLFPGLIAAGVAVALGYFVCNYTSGDLRSLNGQATTEQVSEQRESREGLANILPRLLLKQEGERKWDS